MKKQTISAALSVAALLAAGIALAVPVKVSSFGYNPTDATECLQKALDSGERQLVVDRQDGGWNVRPLKLTKGNVEIVLEPGVVIRAKKGEFVDGYDTLLSVEGATNVVIRGGEGSGIAMNKADYADRSRYAFSTHRHALAPFVRRMWTNVLCGCRKQCMANRCFPAWGWGGFAVMMSGWVLSWTRFTWFAPFQRYPFVPLWFGFIVVMNALCFRRSGHSLLTDHPRLYLLSFPVSSAFWWFFEYLNRYVWNWYYVGVSGIGPIEYLFLSTLCFSCAKSAAHPGI